jgi:hypothetical protein
MEEIEGAVVVECVDDVTRFVEDASTVMEAEVLLYAFDHPDEKDS